MNEGTIAYNPDAQDSIRHSKGKTQRTTKNQKPTPSFPQKKNRQLLSRRESNQACSTNPIPSSTNKNKRGKKENAVHEMKNKKNKKRKQRSSRGPRRGAPEELGPFRRFQSSLLITALISCKSCCVIASS